MTWPALTVCPWLTVGWICSLRYHHLPASGPLLTWRTMAGSPLLAFAPSKVELIVGDFYAGEPAIIFGITAGPLAGKWWYWSEQIQPTVSPGQTVAAGQTVATYAPAGTGIEIGWWTPDGGYPLGHPGYAEGLATNSGGDFRYLLEALGANPGSGAGLSSGPTLGSSYYPTGNPGP